MSVPVRHFATTLFLVIGVFSAHRAVVAAEEKLAQLPLRKVVLFNSDLGFFRHEGDIEGDKQVELKFNIDDINDLLKSMVLEDLGGGRVSTVTYGAREPVTRTLKSFAIDLPRNPTLAELLRQVRGEKIQVDAPNPIIGTIVGIERRRAKAGKDETVETDVLTLLTPTGLRSIPFDSIQQTQLLDPKLNLELQEALAILSKAHRSDKKSVTLEFLGKGKRPVRIGYIQEFPVWKTSYRLVVKDDGSLFLQGWAIVENTTEQDWTNVSLTLVSGQPISFVQDLYQPLYADRPIVVPESYASLSPRTYDQDLAAADADFRKAATPERQFVRRRQSGFGLGGFGGGLGGGGGGGALGGSGPAPNPNGAANPQRPFVTSVVPVVGGVPANAAGAAPAGNPDGVDLNKGVASVAQADNVGELFRYAIDSPVTLARQKSAMLPIVNGAVKGEKLSIYNPAVHLKHPLNGLKLINSTGLHLMQGPITVFDGGEYAGDARIEDLRPGTERLLSYALDLDTEVAPAPEKSSRSLSAVTIAGASLIETHLLDRTRSYIVKNSGAKTKKLLIEYPLDPKWTLVTPKEPAEKTRDLYRFAVTAEPGKPANFHVVEQRIDKPEVVLTKLPQSIPATIDDNPAGFVSAMRERTSDTLSGVKIAKGRLIASREIVRRRQFVVRNPGSKETTIPIDYAVDPQWSLIAPKQSAERGHGFHRFDLKLEQGKPSVLEVVERRIAALEFPIARLTDEQIAAYARDKVVDPDVKAALVELIKRRQALAELAAHKTQLDAQVKEVADEQARIRQNMTQLDRNSELYNRYVKKFGIQEDEIEKLRQQEHALSSDLESRRKALNELFPVESDSAAVDPFEAEGSLKKAPARPSNDKGASEPAKNDDPLKAQGG
jgi:hypothetical protein